MVPGSRAQGRVRNAALLLVCLWMVTLLPGGATAAQTTQAQVIDNSQGSFADGVFQRTSLGPDVTSIQPADPNLVDAEGVVQLSPAGVLKPWGLLPNTLPVAVSGHGVTSLGTHLYSIGGAVSGGYTDAAYWATVDPITGSLNETSTGSGQFWNNSPMPATQAIPYALPGNAPEVPIACNTPVAKRTNVGVVSVPTGVSTGYIYVVGGTVNVPGCTQGISTPIVQRGNVAADGSIPPTSWTTLTSANLPSPVVPDDGIVANDGSDAFDISLGAEAGSVIAAHTRTAGGVDHYFLYMLGGKSVYISRATGSTQQRVLSTVYYSEIVIGDGSLKNPVTGSTTSVWQRQANLPLLPPTSAPPSVQIDEGLWGATASATSITVGTELKTAIFLSGGSYDLIATRLSPYTYRAIVDSATGALTWSTTPGEGSSQVTLAARQSMASLIYNNKFYAIGGRTSNNSSDALDTVPTALLNDSLDVIKIGGTDFFIGTDAVNNKVLESGGFPGRYGAAVAVVRAQPPANVATGTTINTAWAYVIGGNNNAGNGMNTVFLGKLGGDEADNAVRAPEGWYYSGVIKIAIASGQQNKLARVLSINWASDIDRGANPNADIQMEFRKTITASGECADDSIFTTSTDDRWRPVDGDTGSAFFSKPAAQGALFNRVAMADVFGSEQINATCIQYRAHILQNGGAAGVTPTSSPKLLEVYLEKVIAGSADLSIPANGFVVGTSASNRINNFVMKLQNLSDKGISDTLSVDDARYPSAEGSFFVNLCVAYSASASPSLALPDPKTFSNADKITCPAYAVIATSEMGKGTILDLRTSTRSDGQPRWYSNVNAGAPIPDILSLFSTAGYYRIGLVIDTYDFVPESTVGETNNRGETTDQPSGTTIAFKVDGPPAFPIMLPLIRR